MDLSSEQLSGSGSHATTEPYTPQSGQEMLPALRQPSAVHRVFIGPFGLRAGWSLLIYFAILAGIIFGVRAIHDYNKAKEHQAAVATAQASGKPIPATVKHDPNAPADLRDMMTQEGIMFGAIFLISVLMAFIERRRVSAFGLGGQGSVGRFIIGAAWGLAAISLLVGTLLALHLVSFDARLDHGWSILEYGGAQLLLFLFVGLVEEYLFRGYLQFTLTRGLVGVGKLISPTHARTIAFWIATVITSGLFFLAHMGNSGEDMVGLVLVFGAGLMFVVALWRTGSLWWAIGLHMAWDWAQSFLYGVPDSGLLVQGRLFATHAVGNPMLSGGADGPEGSILCIPIMLLVIVVLLFTRSSPQPALETNAHVEKVASEETADVELARA
jgi:membrane protease YdiL (CAAX protease family)